MNLLVSCNDRYTMPLMVMLTSFFSTNPSRAEEVHAVYLLESDLSEPSCEQIEKLVCRFDGAFDRIHLPQDPFASAKTRPHITKETYYRLLASQILPETLERILWLDADMIIRGSVAEFYDLPFNGAMAVACGYGPAMQGLIQSNASALGLNAPDTYFNAGVMLMDLAACRKEITEDDLARFSDPSVTEHFLFPGQDVVNLLFDGRVRLEDYRAYNCMIHCIASAEDLEYAQGHARIVHFPGAAKPWKFNDIHFADEWMTYYRQCFGENADLPRMSYFRLKKLYDRQGRT